VPQRATTTTPADRTAIAAPAQAARAARTPSVAAAVGNRALARAVLARCSCGTTHAAGAPCAACAKDDHLLGRAVADLDGVGAREMARTMQRS
jgi:hypothetical protein